MQDLSRLPAWSCAATTTTSVGYPGAIVGSASIVYGGGSVSEPYGGSLVATK